MTRLKYFLCLCIMLLLPSCGSVNYEKSIGAFQQSVDASVGVIGTYYRDLNSYERSVYLKNALLDPKQEILFIDSKGQPTPLVGNVFSTEGIKARLDCLSLVSMYSKRLAELAGSQVPVQFPENVKVLGDNLTNLANTFSSLTGTHDLTASSYVGPVSSLVGLIGQIYMEKRQDAALTKAIMDGDPLIRKVLDLLNADLVNVIDPLRKTGDKELLVDIVTYYNNKRLSMSYAERSQTIDSIQLASDKYSASVLFNPSSLVSGISEAHQALVRYAKSDKRPNDVAELEAAIELFTARVDIVAGAVRKLQNIR